MSAEKFFIFILDEVQRLEGLKAIGRILRQEYISIDPMSPSLSCITNLLPGARLNRWASVGYAKRTFHERLCKNIL